MDRLDAMRLFVKVAELGSFAAVAARMNVARSVITRQVAALESRLGVKLLARSTRHLALTTAGADYLEKCREILGLVEEAETALHEARQVLRGPIRITLPYAFGTHQLMPAFCEFMAAHPDISLALDYSDRRLNLIEGGYDLAIRISDRLDPGDVARKIGASRGVIVAAPAYLERHGRPRHPDELSGHACFGYLLAEQASWSFIVDGERRWFPVRGRLQANSGEALLEAAINGLGIARAPTFIAERAVRAGVLEVLLPAFPTLELGIHAIFPGSRQMPLRVRALVEHLAEYIGARSRWDDILIPAAGCAPARG